MVLKSNCMGLCALVLVIRVGVVWRGASDPSFLDLLTLSHTSPESSCVGSWVRGQETPCCCKSAFKLFGTKGRESESKITLFFGVYHWLLSPSNKALSSEVL